MKNKKTILGIMVLLFAITVICNVSNVFAIEDPDYLVTIYVGESFIVSGNLNKGEIVRIEYEITEGDADLHFYIKNSDGDTIENLGHVIGYGLYHFYVPYDDYFQIIFRNDCLLAHRHLKLNIDVIEEKTITITSPTSISTFENGYNLTLGGNSVMFGRKHSDKAKRKMSKAKEGKYKGKNHPNYGKHFSEEHRRKLSESQKGKGKYKGKDNPRARAVIIDDKYFDTVKQAAEYLGVYQSTVRIRILHKTKFLEYKYI